MSDPQDRAEALDSDKLGVPDDPDIEPDYPLDELVGADEYGITAAEERVDEPIEERADRETGDPLAREIDRELAERGGVPPDDPGALLLETTDGVGEEVGRLYEPGTDDDVTDFIDEESDSVGGAVPADDLTAEEAAMHVAEDPPMGRPGGGYLD